MVTLQEYLNKSPKNTWTRVSPSRGELGGWSYEGGELDLTGFDKLEILATIKICLSSPITKITLDGCSNLKEIHIIEQEITSVDFLNKLSNPEKLEQLRIYDNNIQPTNISIFSRFVNLEVLQLGTTKDFLEKGKRNKFYGSLESLKNLTKLETLCIEATDVDRGLEYLPRTLVQCIKREAKLPKGYGEKGGYEKIECSPHGTDAKCKAIQDELRPFNYDVEAWQLAHPELITKVRVRTSDKEVKEQILKELLEDKILESKQELQELKSSDPSKVKKIERLESKIKLLEEELGFLAQENNKLKTTIRELEMKNYELVQKLEQINLISQVEVQPK
jgi:hypothetical protein